MNGDEFLRRIKKLGKDRGIAVQFDKRHGKGSHGTLYYGDRKTTLKDRRKEIGPGLLQAMLQQLGLDKRDMSQESPMQTTLYAYPALLAHDKAGRVLVRFRDLPEALTDGATEEEALVEAADCLSEALMSRVADGETIPFPSPPVRGEHQIAPEPTVALKVALNTIAKEARVSAAELARRLRVDHKEARRLLDPHHASKLPRLAEALNALGHEVKITVHDTSRRERLLTSPAEPKPKRMKLAPATRVAPR